MLKWMNSRAMSSGLSKSYKFCNTCASLWVLINLSYIFQEHFVQRRIQPRICRYVCHKKHLGSKCPSISDLWIYWTWSDGIRHGQESAIQNTKILYACYLRVNRETTGSIRGRNGRVTEGCTFAKGSCRTSCVSHAVSHLHMTKFIYRI